ncbi:MAG: AP-3 complex subunit delta [Alyxoria varia]|nr:MAG: AP-3 complex subunit delta [Alyxoria varia]
MFEKSLYDLIRGLRNHKGNERAYIQDCLRECRREIKSQDMDLKATALLKLTYLEMYGHDMSWASFNVLEVMSSPKYPQKRAGYLGAVQSFRPDTEVLMLAENLLKKDLVSPSHPTISLPLIAIPHVISPSMANSLLSDLLPRLSHSHQSIRKKTIVTLYRLALVYPETLRPAWPKIKDRLLDESEDSSVTATAVNVVCELGWRRPQDFLPLSPRLFELLVEGNNNWQAIKIIKLFAHLTPLEPRLIRKLLPPLTTIIKQTPAMSLLYECINGIIQGGIFEGASGTSEGDDVARLCVNKLRGMLVIEGDPNLKYVALLAFNRILEMHPYLVSAHDDVILECIDDPDISIRQRALDLVVGIVNPRNLAIVVERLLLQLKSSQPDQPHGDVLNERRPSDGVEPEALSEDGEAEKSIRAPQPVSKQAPSLPDDYRASVISKILDMCARETYANVNDFDWYLLTLVSLVRFLPTSNLSTQGPGGINDTGISNKQDSAAYRIGAELRNVAVRVKSSRAEATHAAEHLVSIDKRSQLLPTSGDGGTVALESTVWIVGEYAEYLSDPNGTLSSLIHPDTASFSAPTLNAYIPAAMKVFAHIISNRYDAWTPERKTMTTLLMARVIHFLEPLTSHADLEAQEQAVQYLELIRLANEAVEGCGTNDTDATATPPLLLTEATPSLFRGDLNPVAPEAQSKVPVPEDIDLDGLINPHLPSLLDVQDNQTPSDADTEFYRFYHTRPSLPARSASLEPAANRLDTVQRGSDPSLSYQQSVDAPLDPAVAAKRRFQREDRYRDDPFYIGGMQGQEQRSGTGTPVHDILKSNNGDVMDIDSIPIMELNLDENDAAPQKSRSRGVSPNGKRPTSKPRPKIEILADETVNDPNIATSKLSSASGGLTTGTTKQKPSPRSLLQVDSSGLGTLSLESGATKSSRVTQLDIERREAEEAEMAAAMREVERLRLEMQRAQERIEEKGERVVKSKARIRRRKKSSVDLPDEGGGGGEGEKREKVEVDADAAEEMAAKPKKSKKKKKGRKSMDAEGVADSAVAAHGDEDEGQTVVKKKKKKKRRQVTFEEDDVVPAQMQTDKNVEGQPA